MLAGSLRLMARGGFELEVEVGVDCSVPVGGALAASANISAASVCASVTVKNVGASVLSCVAVGASVTVKTFFAVGLGMPKALALIICATVSYASGNQDGSAVAVRAPPASDSTASSAASVLE